jgi:hypothetical protein
MYKRIITLSLLLISLSLTSIAQTKASSSLKGEAAKSREDVIAAAREYQDSLRKLLALREEHVKQAEAEVENRKKLLEQKIINEREVEWALASLSQAKAKVEETRSKIEGADKLIEEVRNEAVRRVEPPSRARNKKHVRRTQPKTSKKPLCKECKDV